MYLKYFNFAEFPFTLTPNTYYFCNLPSYQEALNVLLVSLRGGEGFIKIVGEVGSGKTMLCREFLDHLDDEYVSAYIANPALDCFGLYQAIAKELSISVGENENQYSLLNLINDKLLELHRANKKVVVIIDEAQVLPDQALEGLRLLSNLETGAAKLLQIVLFGQPELDDRLKQENLRQLRQRIAFSYRLRPLNRSETEAYVNYRLVKAGNKYPALFSRKALDLLFRNTSGIPRLINILCHKALIAAFGRGKMQIDGKDMGMAIKDTESIDYSSGTNYLIAKILVLILFLLLAVNIFYEFN
jgi:MSHA biogenesis protein MshM